MTAIGERVVVDGIVFHRVNNGSDGSERYECSYYHLSKKEDSPDPVFFSDGSSMDTNRLCWYFWNESQKTHEFRMALARSRKIGGMKFNNKTFIGGIVFRTNCLQELANSINGIMKEA